MARKDIVDRIGRLARAVANADRKGDDPGVEKWAVRLADASTSLAVLVNPELAETDERFDADLFVDFPDDGAIFMVGGSPGNPNGVTMTLGQAKAWWTRVFEEDRYIGAVRPTLMPGSLVLSAEGLRKAKLGGSVPAPSDWNPLNLEVIA